MSDDWFYKYPKTRPAKGGIKSRSKRGEFGKSWWAKRWISALERFDMGERLTRGRAYARRGQVLAVSVEPGLVTAKVQGSSAKPYVVTIAMTMLTAKQWDTLAATLAQQAIFAAQLLAGEIPHDIEEAFRETGIPLFPDQARDLMTDCTCPDAANPCKHIAAVYYLLGEEFDRDPFLIFKLRGMERESFMAKLTRRTGAPKAPARPRKVSLETAEAGVEVAESSGETLEANAEATEPGARSAETAREAEGARTAKKRSGVKKKGSASKPHAHGEASADAAAADAPAGGVQAARPLRTDPRAFWGAGTHAHEQPMELREPPVPGALPRQLGAFPFWRADMPLDEALAPLYAAASGRTLRRMLAGDAGKRNAGASSGDGAEEGE